MAALERARASRPGDPTIEEAYNRVRRNLLPTVTTSSIQAGYSYATNPLQLPSRDLRPSDSTLDAALTIDDERTLFNARIRTSFVAAGQWQEHVHELDQYKIAISSGPVFSLPGSLWVHVAPGGVHAILNSFRLYDEANGEVTLGGVYQGLTQTVSVRGGWRRGNDELAFSDSSYLSVEGRFLQRPNLMSGDMLYIQPRYYLNHAIDPLSSSVIADTVLGTGTAVSRDLAPESFQEWGGRLTYFVPFADGRVYFGTGLSIFERRYDSFVLNAGALALGVPVATSTKRIDTYFEPTAHLVFPRLISPSMDLRFDYRFEINRSNDDFREFQNHVAGVRIIGSF